VILYKPEAQASGFSLSHQNHNDHNDVNPLACASGL
jgi:hypothetical protein